MAIPIGMSIRTAIGRERLRLELDSGDWVAAANDRTAHDAREVLYRVQNDNLAVADGEQAFAHDDLTPLSIKMAGPYSRQVVAWWEHDRNPTVTFPIRIAPEAMSVVPLAAIRVAAIVPAIQNAVTMPIGVLPIARIGNRAGRWCGLHEVGPGVVVRLSIHQYLYLYFARSKREIGNFHLLELNEHLGSPDDVAIELGPDFVVADGKNHRVLPERVCMSLHDSRREQGLGLDADVIYGNA